MKSKYGHFSDDGREYIVTTPHTPRPWVNFLTNGDYCSLCSHVAGGFSFYKDHRFHGVLRRGMTTSLDDLPGRFIYVKDEQTGEVWNANVHPIGKFDTFEARHGVAYTTIASSYRKIAASLRFFVPRGIDAEMWTIELANTDKKPRKLSVYSLADFTLGNVSLCELDNNFHGLFYEVELTDRAMGAQHKFWFEEYGWSENNVIWPYRAFVTSTRKPDRIVADRSAFFGAFREYHNPAGVEPPLMPEGATAGKCLVGVCQWRITLRPGQRWTTHVAVGIQPNEASGKNRAMIAKLQKPETYDKAWDATRTWWAGLFSGVEVNTPDNDINVMMNTWNKFQLSVNFFFGRGPSYYHKGQYPAMRDSCQDAFGMIALKPELAKENLNRIAHFFFADGQACAGCNRIGIKEGPSVKVDLPLWFVMAAADYIRETGDAGFLDERFPLMDAGESSVYDKMIAGIDRMLEQRGSHGLPLMGKGDWNDAANAVGRGGKGESVWLGQFLCLAIREIAPLMHLKNDGAKLARYEQRADELRRIINETCWDGEWFVRAFRDDGRALGVKGEKEGFIWINSQTWAVIAGIADAGRLNTCMDSVEKHMGTAYGLMNLAPAYKKFDPTVGLITGFRAGWKENGAVFSHASAFNVVARAVLGRGRDAVDLYRRILPTGKDPDTYMIEPYIFTQFCAGPAAGEEHGQGAYHWLTGTAAWMFRAMTDYIIGVRPEMNGLRIKPAVDPSWKQFSMKRVFRGCRYEFDFRNPNGAQTGVKQILLDGKVVDGDLLPLPTKKAHKVVVTM